MSTLKARLQRIQEAEIEAALRTGEVEIRELGRLSGRGYAEERRLKAELLRMMRAAPEVKPGFIDLEPVIDWCVAHYGGTQQEWIDGYRAAEAKEEAARGTA